MSTSLMDSDSIFGQERALKKIDQHVRAGMMGLAPSREPLASLFLVGPTGVGKTESVRQVARELRSGPEDYCRVDMGSFAQEHYAASFSGSPPGYAGSKEGHVIFDRSKVEGDPYTPGIVLFDEFEKAHGSIMNALLQILDNGTLNLANGEGEISFRNCFVFFTSNLGVERWRRFSNLVLLTPVNHSKFLTNLTDRHFTQAVESFVSPEFFNRLDDIIVFDQLSGFDAEQVMSREILELVKVLRAKSITLTVRDDVVPQLVRSKWSKEYGARDVRRTLRNVVFPHVLDALEKFPSAELTMGFENKQVVVRPSVAFRHSDKLKMR